MSEENTRVRRALREVTTALEALSVLVRADAQRWPTSRSAATDKAWSLLGPALLEVREQVEALEPRPEIVTPTPEDPAPRRTYPTSSELGDFIWQRRNQNTHHTAREILALFPSLPSPNAVLNVVAGTNTLSEKVTRIFALFAEEADPAPGPRATTPDSRDRQVDLLAHDVYRSVLESREHEECTKILSERAGKFMPLAEIVDIARKAAADAAKATVFKWRDTLKMDLSPLNLDGKVEGPAPLHELDQNSVGMLQLRRDVKWLSYRVNSYTDVLSNFTIADMLGMDVKEYEALSLKTRQKYSNRAYTALRALNSGAKK